MATFRLSFFLAVRYVLRTSKWQTFLVIFVMTLTFLNLVVASGLLIGLIDGALRTYKQHYSGDLLISKFPEKQYIDRSASVRAILSDTEEVAVYTGRITEPATVEAHFQRAAAQRNLVPDKIGTVVAGIDLEDEMKVTNLSSALIEGDFLRPGDTDDIVLGGNLLDRYFPAELGLQTMSNVFVGDKVRLTVGDTTRIMTVKGVVKTKAEAVDMRIYMLQSELRKMTGRSDYNMDEFAILLHNSEDRFAVKQKLIEQGMAEYGIIKTIEEALGEFLDDIRTTFTYLGNIIGAVSLIVASITIFIIIFITAITRRKYIGILKAIGVSGITIELSYVMLSLFYSVIGVGLGVLFLYLFLEPYIASNPIDFPFSDGVLSVTTTGTTIRSLIILLTTVIAGYFPAKLIVRKNALDAILGR